MPHMHKLGTKLEVTKSTMANPAAQPFYKIDPWTFGTQPMDSMITTVSPTDTLHATCHWNNPGGAPVGYGESSDQEMCIFVLFAYPLAEPDGCVN